ncbi:UDP-N-acetylmuramoyl-L-alanyl-D-glutamate--2,6-diaminopimelate ligase [Candidatus Formimonas warabiya]|uniref:UDP-N-acetylmuramoyl-L-alanyl-D-glutamate--2, 6-diaminopimelate ligase n=1 Tax=Formimonas warabiya TaxID=1761012 RepID=UPI003AB0F5DE
MFWLQLSAIVQYLKAGVQGDPHVEITGVNYDSRKVAPGDLFVCMVGTKSDGHAYVPQALEKGAAAILAQQPVPDLPNSIPQVIVADTREALARLSSFWYHFPCHKLRMIGVTGTNGKTTTTHLIKGLLEQKGGLVGLVGTIHNLVGNEEIASTHTTPESWELAGLLDQMVHMGAHTAVMEVSSHALKQNRVAGCEFDVALFTNLTQDHLDYHLSWEDYLNSKLKLFSYLHIGEKGGAKYAVVNGDDPMAPHFIRAAQVPVWTYGIREKAHIQAHEIKISPRGTTFLLKSSQGEVPLSVSLTGTFNVYNVLAAVTVALLEGMAVPDIAAYLTRAPQVSGRFELVDEGQPFSVIVDYAHTPDGLENILATAKEITRGRLITVFGCGGDRDRGKRPLMGAIAGKYSGFTIVTSDNPRTEDPYRIIEEIEGGISKITAQYQVLEDRRKAIRQAIKMAGPEDTVVIAGKGHETYQIVQGKTHHFDDREVAREELHKLGQD